MLCRSILCYEVGELSVKSFTMYGSNRIWLEVRCGVQTRACICTLPCNQSDWRFNWFYFRAHHNTLLPSIRDRESVTEDATLEVENISQSKRKLLLTWWFWTLSNKQNTELNEKSLLAKCAYFHSNLTSLQCIKQSLRA